MSSRSGIRKAVLSKADKQTDPQNLNKTKPIASFCHSAHRYGQRNESEASPVVCGFAAASSLAMSKHLIMEMLLSSFSQRSNTVCPSGTDQLRMWVLWFGLCRLFMCCWCSRLPLPFAAWTKQGCSALFNLSSSANAQLMSSFLALLFKFLHALQQITVDRVTRSCQRDWFGEVKTWSCESGSYLRQELQEGKWKQTDD